MGRTLGELSSPMRTMAEDLLWALDDLGIDVVIVCTGRTQAEQDDCIRRGTSKVKHSKHQDGNAIDVCPSVLIRTKNWSPSDPLWERVGEIGESVGLVWGGRWKGNKRDCPHFELPE